MQKIFLISGAALGALSVSIGAFGAHALKKMLLENGRTEVFETAVKYQFYHSLALLLVGILMFNIQHKFLNYACYSFLTGILIFSGSLYILAVTNVSKWGAVTPIGGLFLIAGWMLVTLALVKTL